MSLPGHCSLLTGSFQPCFFLLPSSELCVRHACAGLGSLQPEPQCLQLDLRGKVVGPRPRAGDGERGPRWRGRSGGAKGGPGVAAGGRGCRCRQRRPDGGKHRRRRVVGCAPTQEGEGGWSARPPLIGVRHVQSRGEWASLGDDHSQTVKTTRCVSRESRRRHLCLFVWIGDGERFVYGSGM